MSKKNKLKKIHLYIIIGVSVLIIGVLIWGFVTKWKFFDGEKNNVKDIDDGKKINEDEKKWIEIIDIF